MTARLQCAVMRENPRAVGWFIGDWQVVVFGPKDPNWPSHVVIRNAHNRKFAQVYRPRSPGAFATLAGAVAEAKPRGIVAVLDPIVEADLVPVRAQAVGLAPHQLVTDHAADQELAELFRRLRDATRDEEL